MTDNLAPLFTDRATRMAAFDDAERTQLETLEKQSGDAQFIDRQLSALWISKRTGLPHKEILDNYDKIAPAYFGEGTTPAQHYDRIASTYQVASAKAASDQQTATSEEPGAFDSSGSVISKDFAGSLARGASRIGYNTIGGLASAASAASGIRLQRPDERKDFNELGGELAGQMIADWRDFAKQDDTIMAARAQAGIDPTDASMDALLPPTATRQKKRESKNGIIAAERTRIRGEVKAANDAALEKLYEDNPQRFNFVKRMRGVSDLFYELGNAKPEQFGIRPEFADTAVGNFVESAGSLPATALFAYMGPVIGGSATFGNMFADVEQERKAIQGDSYDPTAALFGNVVSAGPQAVMEYAFGMEKVMDKVIHTLPKVGGKIMFGEGIKGMAKASLASGLEEGITEPAQSFWNDVAAKLNYDDKRELFTPEQFKRMAIESGSAFALGTMFGGFVHGIGNVDQNRSVDKADRYLTNRTGGLFTEFDFQALRFAKTDEQLRAMAPDAATGDLLIKAAGGDAQSQTDYNKQAVEKSFVDTDGLQAHGIEIGKIGDQVSLRDEFGRVAIIDQNDPEQVAFLNQVKADAVLQAETTDQTLARLQSKFGEALQVDRPKAFATLAEMVKAGTISEAEANDALDAAKTFNGLVETATLENTKPTGKATAKFDSKKAVWRMAATVLQGASPEVAVEEVGEAWVHKGIKEQNLTFAELHALRADWYKRTGEVDPSTGKADVTPERASIEWFSKRVVEYAVANRKVELPGGWGAWLRTLGDKLREFLAGAVKMRGMLRRGEVAPKMVDFMRQALGVNPEDQLRMNRQADLEAVFSQLPTETQQKIMDLENALSDFEKLKYEYRQQQAMGLQAKRSADRAQDIAIAQGLEDRMRALDFDRAKLELKIEDAIKIPDGVELSAQAQQALDKWESYSLESVQRDQAGQMFSLAQTETPADARQEARFETNGIPQNKRQAYQQQLAKFAVKNAANFPYPYHQLAALPIQAKVSLAGHEAGLMGKVLLPMSERLRYISDKFGTKIGLLSRTRKYYFDKGVLLKKYSDMVKPLMTGITRMNATDLREWSMSAANQDKMNRDRLTAKYGLQAEWAQYEAARDTLRARMLAAGVEVGLIEEYFPRWCKDVVGLRESLGIDASENQFEQAIIDEEKRLGRALTGEEVNDVMDAAVRGITSPIVGGAKPSNTKARKIATIQPGQYEFYADANHALSRWLSQSTEAIARYEFFGKNVQKGGPTLLPSQFNADASIGAVIAEEVAAGNIKPTQALELKEMMNGLFKPKGVTSDWMRGFMDLSYWATMGKLSSTLAQVVDLTVSVYEAGPWNTAVSLPSALLNNFRHLPIIGNVKSWSEAVGKATKQKILSRENLGIDRMLDEFNDQQFTLRALNQVFTATGLTFIDGIGKDVMLNAKFRQMSKQAASGNLSKSNMKMLNGIFGTVGAQSVIQDLKLGRMTDDVKFAVYNVLADWQPISLLEYPEAYAKGGNLRMLYMLKSYSIKMLSAYRREGFMKMWYGDARQKVEGARNLTALLAMLFMAGFSKDWLVDFMLDRDPQPDDLAIDNMFKLMQVSRYAVWKSRNRANDGNIYGFAGTIAETAKRSNEVIMDIVAPPLALVQRPASDIGRWLKAEQNGDAFDYWGAESTQFIPIAGEFIFWRGETGQAKIERRRQLRERDSTPTRRRKSNRRTRD